LIRQLLKALQEICAPLNALRGMVRKKRIDDAVYGGGWHCIPHARPGGLLLLLIIGPDNRAGARGFGWVCPAEYLIDQRAKRISPGLIAGTWGRGV
jgi:hypothetical protein